MSLSSLLPTPTNAIWDREDERRLTAKGAPKIGALVSAKIAAPPYGQRKDWIPRTEADFGDGGAFPEIHVAQYPLGKMYISKGFIHTTFPTIFPRSRCPGKCGQEIRCPGRTTG